MPQNQLEKNNPFSFFTANEQTESHVSSWIANKIREFKDLPYLVQQSTLIGLSVGSAIGLYAAVVGIVVGAPVGAAIGFGVGSLISAALDLMEKVIELINSSLEPDVKPYEDHLGL